MRESIAITPYSVTFTMTVGSSNNLPDDSHIIVQPVIEFASTIIPLSRELKFRFRASSFTMNPAVEAEYIITAFGDSNLNFGSPMEADSNMPAGYSLSTSL